MDDKTKSETSEQQNAVLFAQQRSPPSSRIDVELSKSPPAPGGSAQAPISDLQRMEAEWVSRELDEFVKLIQQYRALYVTAIFVAVGWVLAQAVGGDDGPPGAASPALESFRHRQDIAAVLCIVPLLNVLFAVLVAEAYAHMKSLARYRFILGFALGGGSPAWRWERWRDTEEGSTHGWTNPLNVFSLVILLIFTAGALVFPFPAVWNSNSWWLWTLWGMALILSLALIVVLAALGIRNRHRNAVADPPVIRWSDLGLSEKEKVNARLSKEAASESAVVQQASPPHQPLGEQQAASREQGGRQSGDDEQSL